MAGPEKVGEMITEASIDLSKFDKGIKQIADSQEKLAQSSNKVEQSLNKTEKAANAAAGSISQLEAQAKALREKLEMLAPGTQKFVDTAKKLSSVEQTLKNVQQAAANAAGSGGMMQSVFSKLAVTFTAANIAANLIQRGIQMIGHAFVDSIKSAAAFETILAKISTVATNSTKKDIADLGKQVIELTKVFPKTKEELGIGLYNILQAGVEDTADAMKILKVSTETAIGGQAEVGTVTKLLTSIMSAYGMSVDEASKSMEGVFVAAQMGKAELPDLSSALANVMQTASQLNVPIEEVAAAIETMVNAGQSADEAGTSLNSLFNSVIQTSKGTGEAADEAKRLGLEFNSTALRTKGLQKFMEDMKTAVGDDEVSMQILSGNIRGFRAAASIGGKGAQEFTNILDAQKDSVDAIHTAFLKMTETTESKWTLAMNAAGNASLAFGTGILPEVNKEITIFTDFMNKAIPVAQGLGTAIGFALAGIRQMLSELPGLMPLLTHSFELVQAISNLIPRKKEPTPPLFFTGSIGNGTRPTDQPTKSSTRPSAAQQQQEEADIKDLLKTRDEKEKEILKTYEDQATTRLEMLRAERESLQQKKDTVGLTQEEEKRYARINGWIDRSLTSIERIKDGIEQQNEKVKDAVDAWNDVKKQIDDVNGKIDDLNAKMAELNKKQSEDTADLAVEKYQKIKDLLLQIQNIKDTSTDGINTDLMTTVLQNRDPKNKDLALTGSEISAYHLSPDMVDATNATIELQKEQKSLGDFLKQNVDLSEELKSALNVGDSRFLDTAQKILKDNPKFSDSFSFSQKDAFGQLATTQEKDRKEIQDQIDKQQKILSDLQMSEEAKKRIVQDALEARRVYTENNYKSLEDATQKHIEKQIDQFNQLKAAIDALTNANASLSRFETSASDKVLQGRANGGPIFGPGTDTSDNILVRMSPGEHVLTAGEVRAMGGHQAVYAFREAIRSGIRDLPRFATGGTIHDDHSVKRSLHLEQHYHGPAARMGDPALLRWHARRIL